MSQNTSETDDYSEPYCGDQHQRGEPILYVLGDSGMVRTTDQDAIDRYTGFIWVCTLPPGHTGDHVAHYCCAWAAQLTATPNELQAELVNLKALAS